MLEKEFNFYVTHQGDLVQKYKGKHIVIVDDKVVGVYDDDLKAYLESKEKYGLGHFLIQLVGPGEENYTINFHGVSHHCQPASL